MKEERRIAMAPSSLGAIGDPSRLFFEKGYGNHLGIDDSEYQKRGANLVERKKMPEMDMLCIPKRSSQDRELFSAGQTIFGWLYVPQTPWLAAILAEKGMTAIAFEKMYAPDHTYVFRENRHITGLIGMMQALVHGGKPPGEYRKIALLGNGNVGHGAREVLDGFGMGYDTFTSSSAMEFFGKIGEYDMVVNCVCWDFSKGFLVNKEHLKQMKTGSYLVDLSSEGIEDSTPQSIHSPAYAHNQIRIFNNEHIPTLWPEYASEKNGEAIVPFINDILMGIRNDIIEKAKVMIAGVAIDPRISALLESIRHP